VVLRSNGAVRGENPSSNRDSVNAHGNPLKEDRENRLSSRSAGLGNVENTEGDLCEDKGANDQADPNVLETGLTKELSEAGKAVLDAISQRNSPDTRSPDSRDNHDRAGNENTLGRSVDIAEEERVRVVGLPGREEHRQARAESRDNTSRRGSQAHGSGSEQTAERAVQRVNAVVEEFAEAAGGSGSSSLLSVEVIHCLIHEETERETEVEP